MAEQLSRRNPPPHQRGGGTPPPLRARVIATFQGMAPSADPAGTKLYLLEDGTALMRATMDEAAERVLFKGRCKGGAAARVS